MAGFLLIQALGLFLPVGNRPTHFQLSLLNERFSFSPPLSIKCTQTPCRLPFLDKILFFQFFSLCVLLGFVWKIPVEVLLACTTPGQTAKTKRMQ